MEKRFEYKVTSAYKPTFPEQLEKFAKEGWELMGMNYQGWTVEFVLKRPVE